MSEFASGSSGFLTAPDDGVPLDYVVPILSSMFKSGELSRSEMDDAEDLLDHIEEMPLHESLMMEMVPRFISYQRSRRVIQGVTSRDLDDVDSLAGSLMSISRVAREASSSQGSGRRERAIDLIDSFLPSSDKEVVGLGIRSIDSRMSGGLPVGQTGMICAYTGYGKSSFGLHMCNRNARLGKHSTFFTFEMPKAQVMCRYVSSLIGYPYDLIWKGDYTGQKTREEINEEVREELGRRMSRDRSIRSAMENLEIVEIVDRSPTHLDVEMEIDRLLDDGVSPKLVVVDYLEIMSLPQAKEFEAASKETRDRLGELSNQLTRIFRTRHVAGWILTQANDEGAKTSSPGLTASRDSRKKNDPVSIWCSLGGSEAQISRGVFNFRCAKNRDGEKFKTKIRGDGSTQTFYDYDDEMMAQADARTAAPGAPARTISDDFA